MDRNESVAPNGAAAAARARAKERITDAWELKGKATTATCGGGDDAAGAIVFASARLGVAWRGVGCARNAMRCRCDEMRRDAGGMDMRLQLRGSAGRFELGATPRAHLPIAVESTGIV